MKNIHVLPTDKPSRLRYNLSNILVLTKEFCRDYGKQVNQNIYITSDEKPRQGDWVLNSWNEIHQITKNDKSKSYKKTCKKIILTTDQDLIKDGVQAIDDDFLEWFCSKNGKVDFVEMKLLDAEEKLWEEYYKKNSIYPKYPWYYKIIIPKEEPKQETLEEVFGSSMCQFSVVENKLAILYRNQVKIYNAINKQQKRSYSEEEVIELLKIFDEKFNSGIVERNKGINNWFEQFKKK